jgi:creatinine amidohydrolase
VHVETATWTDVDGVETDLALLPVGSTEQHGPHAPLGTDTRTAETVADRAADRYDGEVVVAPAVPVGVAEEHRAFAGTLWTTPSTFRAYVRDVVGSLAHHGFDRVVVVNGHGGNVPALGEVCATVCRHDDAYAVPFTWFDEVGDHAADMGHGGPLETAFLQHATPALIREDRLAEARDGGSERWGDWQGKVNLAVDSDEFTDNGVVGDPTAGGAELGAELLELATDALVDLLTAVSTRPLPDR